MAALLEALEPVDVAGRARRSSARRSPGPDVLHRGRPLPGPHRRGRPAAKRGLSPPGRILRRALGAARPAAGEHGRGRHPLPPAPADVRDLQQAAGGASRLPDSLEERIEQYDFRHTAQIPIDMFREILPADAGRDGEVGDRPDRRGPHARMAGRRRPAASRRRRTAVRRQRGAVRQAPAPDPPLPPPLADRRDGLRRDQPRHGLPALREEHQPGPDPPAGAHQPRRRQPAGHLPGRERAGSRRARREGLAREPRPDAAARDRPLGGQPLGGAVRRDADARARLRSRRSASGGSRGPSSQEVDRLLRRSSTTPPEFENRRTAKLGHRWLLPFFRPYGGCCSRRPRSP